MSQRSTETESLRTLLQRQRVLVCCGAGGVGKTTSAAALALSAARLGRKTLVLTIDPSKRLAETLSISRDAPAPTALSIPAFEALGLPPEQLSAWVLDPKQVSDRVVLERSGARATRLLANPIYQGVSAMVAGMQEYTAIEALHRFIRDARYELIILDTPPSRHALRFLDAPTRVQRFLDRRIFQLFLPQRGLIGRVAGRIIDEVLDRAFGPAVNRQLREFFEDFSPILAHLEENQREMERFFQSDALSFLLVTTPNQTLLAELQFFAEETRGRRKLHLGGLLLNRCPMSGAAVLSPEALDQIKASPPLQESLDRLRAEGATRRATVEGFVAQLSNETPLYMLPDLGTVASSLEGIIQLSDEILDARSLDR